MEAGQATAPRQSAQRLPSWLAGLLPLVVLGAAIAIFVALDAPGLQRNGVPVEEIAVEKTVLRPGQIELAVRNDGPDAVQVGQVTVNDAFTAFTQTSDEIGRLGASTVTVDYPWIEGQAYEVALVTATGGTTATAIDVAAETPETGVGFLGLMALVGIYVGVIPVAIGMLWLPWIRGIDPRYVQFLLALTVGLLAFLGSMHCSRAPTSRRRARRPSAARRWCTWARRSPTWRWSGSMASCAGARSGKGM